MNGAQLIFALFKECPGMKVSFQKEISKGILGIDKKYIWYYFLKPAFNMYVSIVLITLPKKC